MAPGSRRRAADARRCHQPLAPDNRPSPIATARGRRVRWPLLLALRNTDRGDGRDRKRKQQCERRAPEGQRDPGRGEAHARHQPAEDRVPPRQERNGRAIEATELRRMRDRSLEARDIAEAGGHDEQQSDQEDATEDKSVGENGPPRSGRTVTNGDPGETSNDCVNARTGTDENAARHDCRGEHGESNGDGYAEGRLLLGRCLRSTGGVGGEYLRSAALIGSNHAIIRCLLNVVGDCGHLRAGSPRRCPDTTRRTDPVPGVRLPPDSRVMPRGPSCRPLLRPTAALRRGWTGPCSVAA